MLGLYLFQRYLNRLSDYDFVTKWETKIVPRSRFYFMGSLVYFVIGVGVISQLLLWGNDSVFFSILVFLFVTMIYGFYFIRQGIKFLAINNQRFLRIKTGQQTNGFNKDNVVG